MIGFLDGRDIDVLDPSFDEVIDLLQNRFATPVTEDPFRVSLSIEGEATVLTVSLADDVHAVELERHQTA